MFMWGIMDKWDDELFLIEAELKDVTDSSRYAELVKRREELKKKQAEKK